MRCVRVAILICITAVSTGCAYTARPDWQLGAGVAVPAVTDRIPDGEMLTDLAAKSTQAIRHLISTTGEFRLMSVQEADYRLDCEIRSYSVQMLSTDQYGDPLAQRVIIRVNISLWNNRTGTYMIRNREVTNLDITPESGVFDITQGGSRQRGVDRAVADLARAVYHCIFEIGAPSDRNPNGSLN